MSGVGLLQEYCKQIGCICMLNEPMTAHTTFRIGGPADLMIRPNDNEAASLVIKKSVHLDVPITIIGKGSNLLVSDYGIRGVVLSMDEQTAEEPKIIKNNIVCKAGTSLARLCAFAMKNGLSGLEFAWGIPGSVGGGVYMNAGAYGGEIKDSLVSVEYLDPDGETHEIKTADMQMGYRRSWFTTRERCLITKATFSLSRKEPLLIRAEMEEYMAARKEKQPLDYPSAGSTFKRPTGAYASQLIEQCGLKGRRIGGAMVSKKHAGFLINYDKATCEDVKLLIEEVKRVVKQQTGFSLECEVKRL